MFLLSLQVNMVDREKVFELATVSKKESGALGMQVGSKFNANNDFFDVNEYMQSSSSLDENNQSKKRGVSV